MAVGARDREVASCQREVRLLVIGKRERGGTISFNSVAAITSVEIGGSGKLSGVTIGVTLSTAIELDLK